MFRPFIDHHQENADIEDGKLVLDLGYCVRLVERFVCTFSLIFKQSFLSRSLKALSLLLANPQLLGCPHSLSNASLRSISLVIMN
jgi:hypothetical protein